MATFDNHLYNFPTSPFTETFWTSWNFNDFPVSPQNDELKTDASWLSAISSMPDYSCLPLYSFSSLAPTGDPIYIPQIPDSQFDPTGWVPPADTFGAPVLAAAPTAFPCARNFTTDCNPFQDSSNPPSGVSTPTDRSSPSESSSSRPSPTPSAVLRTKHNRDMKGPIRCWEHSCGGRAFSSLGNYERHLREKSGRAKSFTCEQCGQRFTRSTAKNKHIKHGRCRARQA
ncbi:uncharacterized protein BDW70DRAFT_27167 [Aspergillus foveolatus]|uniref:uncharacterized protein n=1 Tax=Aspergillus foveolatus TaxID=210207 RepID=UPI003CCE38DB